MDGTLAEAVADEPYPLMLGPFALLLLLNTLYCPSLRRLRIGKQPRLGIAISLSLVESGHPPPYYPLVQLPKKGSEGTRRIQKNESEIEMRLNTISKGKSKVTKPCPGDEREDAVVKESGRPIYQKTKGMRHPSFYALRESIPVE